MRTRFLTGGMMFAVVTLLSGCTVPSNEPPIFISHGMEDDLNRYFTLIGSVNSGAFAISPDGRHAFYSYCLDSSCGSISLSQEALQHCKGMAGTECVILANGRNIIRPYKVADGSGAVADATPVQPLSGTEIEHRIRGNTLSGFHSDGAQWKIYFGVDHQARAVDDNRKLVGTWAVSNNRLCLDYAGADDDWCGEFRISTLLGGSKTLDVYRDGKLWQSMDLPTTVPGNPWDL